MLNWVPDTWIKPIVEEEAMRVLRLGREVLDVLEPGSAAAA